MSDAEIKLLCQNDVDHGVMIAAIVCFLVHGDVIMALFPH